MSERLLTTKELLRYVRTNVFDVHGFGRRAIEREHGEVTCKPGCAYCCYAKIIVHVADGIIIYLALRPQWTPTLERKLIDADRALTAASHAEWLGKRRPCVFLREERFGKGTCSIYPQRPIACAITFSVNPDPSCCAIPGGRDLATVKSDRIGKVFGQLHADVAVSFKQTHSWMFTMPGAVLYGRALVEELPLPDVHRVALEDVREDDAGEKLEDRFDRTGAERSNRP